MSSSIYWLTVIALLLGPTANHPGYAISERPLNFNGSKRTGCVDGVAKGAQPAERTDSSMRLRQLRSEMARITSVQGAPLNGYIVTSDDEHQSETVAPHDMRREFLTGFYGSAGEAVVTSNKAVLWTDGRYHLQADQQLDCNWMLMRINQENVPTITEWLKREFENNSEARIGADPMLIPAYTWQDWESSLAESPIRLVAVRNNLIDLIWQVERPSYNPYGAYPLAIEYAGRPWQEKIQQVRLEMQITGADALVVTALDEIAWLLNIRGYDLPNTPVLRSYVIVTHGSIHLYAQRQKVLRPVDTHLKMDSCYHADCVKWHNYTAIWDDLRTMSQAWTVVWLPSRCGYAPGASKEIYASIPSEKRLPKASPIIDLRAEKNAVEAEGMRKSHIRDAMAMCDFLAYMEEQIHLDSAGWDEMQVARVANEFRLEQDHSQGVSFPTIAGYGAHSALPHYMPSERSNVPIGTESTLIVDSGGQYLDGTTDVTRTLHFGEPTKEQKEAYTRVLIGSIQLSSLTFPSNLRTDQLDVLARGPLWSVGHDYMHGTGHGIGHFSSVHETPINIAYVGGSACNLACNSIRLKPGYFFSNEPGYYKEGDFGIRLENIVEVVEANVPRQGTRPYLKLNDVTLVPYEPKLIEVKMLSPAHRRWLNNYNQRIRDKVGAELKNTLRMKAFFWMLKKTRSIPETDPVDEEFFKGSHASPSISKNSSLLVVAAIFYHIFTCEGSADGVANMSNNSVHWEARVLPAGPPRLLGWNVPAEELVHIPEHWLVYPEPNPSLHYLLALLYILFTFVALLGNGLVLWIFCAAKSLRTPSNMFVVNLAFCDFFMMIKTPIFIYNSFNTGFALGNLGCQIFAFIGSLSGIGASMTNAAIAYDRYSTIAHPLDGKLSRGQVMLFIILIWTYVIPWALMPSMGVWGRFVPEGFLTSCTFDYLTDSAEIRYFVATIFTFSYAIPMSLIIYYYSQIVSHVVNHEKALREQAKKMNVESLRSNANSNAQSAEIRIAKAAITICFLFVCSWTPYGVCALIGAFGNRSLLTPGVTMIPACACKFVACLDPYVYAISHPRYRLELQKRLPWLELQESPPPADTTSTTTETVNAPAAAS